MSRTKGIGRGEEPEKRISFRYASACRKAVEEHIARCLGSWEQCFQPSGHEPQELAVPLIPPRREGEGYLLCTLGLGAVVMAPPEGDADRDLRRAEVFLSLVPEWTPFGADSQALRPITALLELARQPLAEPEFWIGPGRIFHLAELAAGGWGQCCLLLLPPEGSRTGVDPCILPDGEPVRFYQALTLYEEEAELLASQGQGALWDKLGGENFRVDPRRENSCKKP